MCGAVEAVERPRLPVSRVHLHAASSSTDALKSRMMMDRPLRFCTPHPGIEWQHLSRVRWKDNTPLSTVAESGCPSDQQLHRRASRGLHLRNVRAARGCSAVLSSSAVRLRWRANAVGGKSRTELDPLPATATNNPRFRHQCVKILKREGGLL